MDPRFSFTLRCAKHCIDERSGARKLPLSCQIDGLVYRCVRRNPIEERKDRLAGILRRRHPGIAINETYDGDGAVVYQHACTLGCEGIVSKRRGSSYRMGRTDAWVKIKNPNAPAVRREREIDWAKR